MLSKEIEKYDQQSQPDNDRSIKRPPGAKNRRTIMIMVIVMGHICKSSKSLPPFGGTK